MSNQVLNLIVQISDLRNAVKCVESERRETVAFEVERKVSLPLYFRNNCKTKLTLCRKALPKP